MKEVSKEKFWSAIKQLNVHPHPVGKYPYTTIFKSPDGAEHGRIEPTCAECNFGRDEKYFLND